MRGRYVSILIVRRFGRYRLSLWMIIILQTPSRHFAMLTAQMSPSIPILVFSPLSRPHAPAIRRHVHLYLAFVAALLYRYRFDRVAWVSLYIFIKRIYLQTCIKVSNDSRVTHAISPVAQISRLHGWCLT